MPRPGIDWSDSALWDGLYGGPLSGSGYSRSWQTAGGTHPLLGVNAWGDPNPVAARVDAWIALGIGAADRVLIGGSGLGFSVIMIGYCT